ncbi:FAD-dependent oxidoreductase [Spiractinospora alimapuensis]|uniref:protoporphyrinogen/coproporphyrinogen oxidase n=1 Tax=Spiractinospora alimapuensis TaxID=2820884 RepID=UPI001F2AA2AF|nr:FAD-dependent oxidoreductase [Spiractinospora alimapuensis]QVQ52965.1 FAD-dependent oxidoreductase [Spiractinospora alimapuensis]
MGRRDADLVIVVGAGIAGLSAAHRLTAAGVPTRVLEAEMAPGGRIATRPLGDGLMELGAQFLSTGYEILPGLLSDIGLTGQTSPVSGRSLILSRRHAWAFDLNRPTSLLSSGLLRMRDLPPAARGWHTARSLATRPTHDAGAWADLGSHSARSWAEAAFGPGLSGRLLSPTVHGLYFQSLAENSAALLGPLAAFSARGASPHTLRGGLGQLPRALAAPLTVEYDVRVHDVRRPDLPGRPVTLSTNRGERTARTVVLATPGPATRRMLHRPTPPEAAVLAVPYSPGLLVGLALASPLAEDELGGAYGVLVNPPAPTPLAAVAVHSRADVSTRGEVLTAMFRPGAARRLATASDTDIHAAAVDALAPLLPEVRSRVRDGRVVRWDAAMPTVPVGHPSAVRQYRRSLPVAPSVLLAGDHLGFPWTDAAAYNGRWAAERVIEAECC